MLLSEVCPEPVVSAIICRITNNGVIVIQVLEVVFNQNPFTVNLVIEGSVP